jgi:hypothetical protein
MNRPVILTTPIPTWQEMADFYGLSKSDRKFVDGLFTNNGARTRTASAKKRPTARTSSGTGIKASRFEVKLSGRKTNGRARKAA